MYLFIDCETTGLRGKPDYSKPHTTTDNQPDIVQLAWVAYADADTRVSAFEVLVYPDGYEIPQEATKIHGISTESARQNGVPLAVVMQSLSVALAEAHTIIGHNVQFDLGAIKAALHKTSTPNPLQDQRIYCTMRNTVRLVGIASVKPGYLKYPTLTELHQFLFGTSPSVMHSALADALTTAACYWELQRRKP